jgi:AcrR family transcriptional regulator
MATRTVPRTRLTREESRALTRSRVLAAAGEVFAEEGFHAASLEEVADRAGYSIGAVYSNFRSKDDLFLSLMTNRLRAFEDGLAAAFAETTAAGIGGGAGSKAAMIEAELRQIELGQDARPKGWWRLMNEFRAYAEKDPDTRARLQATQSRCFGILSDHIARFASSAGVTLPMPPNEIAEIAMAAGDGLDAAYAQGRSSVRPGLAMRRIVAGLISAGEASDPA